MSPRPTPDEKEDFGGLTASVSNESDDKSTRTNTGTSDRTTYDLTHMDSAGDYSIGSSRASMQMAQYLDDVESGGANDICSFQDVNLDHDSPDDGLAHRRDLGDVRRARRQYYLLPMLIKYRLPIGGCLAAFAVLLVTVAVTAGVVRQQDKHHFVMTRPDVASTGNNGELMPSDGAQGQGYDTVGGWDDTVQQEDEGEESVGDFYEHTTNTGDDRFVQGEGEDAVGMLYDDAPLYDDAAETETTNDDVRETSYDDARTVTDDAQTVTDDVRETSYDDAGQTMYDDGEEDVGEPLEFASTNADDDGQVEGEEDVGVPLEFTPTTDDSQLPDRTDDGSAGSTSNTGSTSTSNGASSSGSGNGSSYNPKWYSTSHPSYTALLDFHSDTGSTVSPHHTAALFCNDLGQKLCPYSAYCPSGKGADPYNDGPGGLFDMARDEWEQWAPVNTHGQGVEWVQVGKLLDADGSYGGRCRLYDEWSGGQDLETTVSSEHRRYILCCNNQDV